MNGERSNRQVCGAVAGRSMENFVEHLIENLIGRFVRLCGAVEWAHWVGVRLSLRLRGKGEPALWGRKARVGHFIEYLIENLIRRFAR
jgi:hypothetical protein